MIQSEGKERILGRLRTIQRQAVRFPDLESVGANVASTILLRTRRGEFLPGSTGRGYSKGHAKKREARGLQTAHVDLFMGKVGVLESIRSQVRELSTGGQIRISAGYISGLSEARAAEIGKFLDTQGAGKSRVTYKHIGLTSGEESRVLANLNQRILGHLNDKLD